VYEFQSYYQVVPPVEPLQANVEAAHQEDPYHEQVVEQAQVPVAEEEKASADQPASNKEEILLEIAKRK
jgi:hypothetical protein